MATTTNYGWTTPDDTALVKDGASAIRSLGTSVDTTTKNLNPSTTLGDIEYRSSTANTNTRLAIGTTGQVLTVAAGVPSWATPAGGGGKVLQVVQGTTSTVATTTSTTFVDTNLTATITPSAATSKILVIVSQDLLINKSSSDLGAGLQIYRGASAVFGGTDKTMHYFYDSTGGTTYYGTRIGMSYLDSPATTSATTYTTKMAVSAGTITATANGNSLEASIILMEIGA